jgi:hypothetical protein
MKVHIGPYKDWLGPYQLAEKLCFWVKNRPDEDGIMSKPRWVHKFGELLAHGSISPEPAVGDEIAWGDDRNQTQLYRFLSWIHAKKQRRISVHIDRWDTWSMDTNLGYIIRPMLKQLQASKHGAPFVDDEDVTLELRSTSARELTQEEKDTGHTDDNHFLRWEWVLNEMIFAFDSLEGGENANWEEQFTTGEYDFRFKKIDENGTSQMVHGPNHTVETDWDARKAYGERIRNGFSLFGKYYQSLWD